VSSFRARSGPPYPYSRGRELWAVHNYWADHITGTCVGNLTRRFFHDVRVSDRLLCSGNSTAPACPLGFPHFLGINPQTLVTPDRLIRLSNHVVFRVDSSLFRWRRPFLFTRCAGHAISSPGSRPTKRSDIAGNFDCGPS
jgi:hypothetical protein